MAKITTDDLMALHEEGVLRFAAEPGGGAPVCMIGDSWFYFAGAEGDADGADAYLAAVPLEDCLAQAADALDGWDEAPCFADEHAYYAALVRESLLRRADAVAGDASNIRSAVSFLGENEQFGDDWSDEIASLDKAIAALDGMEARLRTEADRFDDEVTRAQDAT